jgi:hypothetical protein
MSIDAAREGSHQSLDKWNAICTHIDKPSRSPVSVLDRHQGPSMWAHTLSEIATQRSDGIVDHHLVGAILERRFRGIEIPNYPAHPGSRPTSRAGDFEVSNLVYHVTTTPIQSTFQKCAENIRAGLHPILLVPAERENKALRQAQDEGIGKRISVIPMEAFVTLNIVHLATDEDKDFFDVLKEIVEIYNRRLAAVESDLALQIQVR